MTARPTGITADADKVSGIDFFDAVTGSSPEKREARRNQMHENCIRAIESGDTYGWPPAMVDHCREIMAARGQPTVPYTPISFDTEGLTEVHGDPFRRVA